MEYMGFPCDSAVKHLQCMERKEMRVQSLYWEDSLEEEMKTQSSISCLENAMDRGDWWATVHEIVKSQTRLSN